MNSLRIAFLPGLIAGVISIFTSWFWVAVVFHKYQRRTPQTWRAETAVNHLVSSLVQLGACLASRPCMSWSRAGMEASSARVSTGAIWFAFLAGAPSPCPILINNALYVNLHPLVTLGLLLNWLTTALLASLITGWWLVGY